MDQKNKKIMNRLRRAEGQIRGVQKMLDENKECRDIVTQLSAIRSSIDKAIGVIVAENLVYCLDNQELTQTEKDARVQEAVNLLVKSK